MLSSITICLLAQVPRQVCHPVAHQVCVPVQRQIPRQVCSQVSTIDVAFGLKHLNIPFFQSHVEVQQQGYGHGGYGGHGAGYGHGGQY